MLSITSKSPYALSALVELYRQAAPIRATRAARRAGPPARDPRAVPGAAVRDACAGPACCAPSAGSRAATASPVTRRRSPCASSSSCSTGPLGRDSDRRVLRRPPQAAARRSWPTRPWPGGRAARSPRPGADVPHLDARAMPSPADSGARAPSRPVGRLRQRAAPALIQPCDAADAVAISRNRLIERRSRTVKPSYIRTASRVSMTGALAARRAAAGTCSSGSDRSCPLSSAEDVHSSRTLGASGDVDGHAVSDGRSRLRPGAAGRTWSASANGLPGARQRPDELVGDRPRSMRSASPKIVPRRADRGHVMELVARPSGVTVPSRQIALAMPRASRPVRFDVGLVGRHLPGGRGRERRAGIRARMGGGDRASLPPAPPGRRDASAPASLPEASSGSVRPRCRRAACEPAVERLGRWLIDERRRGARRPRGPGHDRLGPAAARIAAPPRRR